MSVLGKLKALVSNGQLADDGSRELAAQWMKTIHDEESMRALLQNDTFQALIEQMKADFISRLEEVVNDDPELKAMRRMFTRTIGLKGSKEKVLESIKLLLEKPE